MYAEQPNILTPSLAPFTCEHGARFSQNLKPTAFTDFLTFNNQIETKQNPFRHTFIVSGGLSLLAEGESPAQFADHLAKVCFKNPFDRGFSLKVKGLPVALPVPFPRMFSGMTEHGF